jgi:hypothetical protein
MQAAPIERFRDMTDEDLYDAMARCAHPGDYRLAVEELQRRLLQRVELQVRSLAASSAKLEKLTWWLAILTGVLVFMTFVLILEALK